MLFFWLSNYVPYSFEKIFVGLDVQRNFRLIFSAR